MKVLSLESGKNFWHIVNNDLIDSHESMNSAEEKFKSLVLHIARLYLSRVRELTGIEVDLVDVAIYKERIKLNMQKFEDALVPAKPEDVKAEPCFVELNVRHAGKDSLIRMVLRVTGEGKVQLLAPTRPETITISAEEQSKFDKTIGYLRRIFDDMIVALVVQAIVMSILLAIRFLGLL